jgi:nucleotide-binding universal stress UspA family protein
MIRLNNILVPVDFSEPSKQAVNYGLALARMFRARLTLAHIVPLMPVAHHPFPANTFDIEQTDFDRAKVDMGQMIPSEFRRGLNFEVVARMGDVQHEIDSIVHEKDVDMMVIGTHGRRAFERFFLGSLTERMLRKIPVPILMVSHLDPAHVVTMDAPVTLRNILFATNFPEERTDRIHFAAELARTAGAILSVIHVVEPLAPLYASAEMLGMPPTDQESVRRTARKQLERLIEHERDGALPIVPVLREGVPSEEIIRHADESKADLIILNLSELGRLERALLGSTAERVIRSATIPVLSLPDPGGYAAGRLTLSTETIASM